MKVRRRPPSHVSDISAPRTVVPLRPSLAYRLRQVPQRSSHPDATRCVNTVLAPRLPRGAGLSGANGARPAILIQAQDPVARQLRPATPTDATRTVVEPLQIFRSFF